MIETRMTSSMLKRRGAFRTLQDCQPWDVLTFHLPILIIFDGHLILSPGWKISQNSIWHFVRRILRVNIRILYDNLENPFKDPKYHQNLKKTPKVIKVLKSPKILNSQKNLEISTKISDDLNLCITLLLLNFLLRLTSKSTE